MIRFFGHRYLAPMYDDAPEVHPPTGALCAWCGEVFLATDDGIVVDAVGLETVALSDGTDGLPYHRVCFLRTIIGSVAHVEERCSCFVPGADEGDPPGMTKRQAAELALRRSYERNP
jgi:hypothetical protein